MELGVWRQGNREVEGRYRRIELFQLQEHAAAVEVSVGIVRPALDHLFVAGQGILRAPHFLEQVGPIVMCVWIVTIELQRALVGGQGFAVSLEGDKYAALVTNCRC